MSARISQDYIDAIRKPSPRFASEAIDRLCAMTGDVEPEPELDHPLRMDQDRQDVEEYRERERG